MVVYDYKNNSQNYFIMVTIIGFKQIEKEGRNLVFIEVQGDLKMVQSQESGQFYMTANKTSILSSFPLEVCKTLVGQKLPGNVERVECEPYQYTNKETGETSVSKYRCIYVQEEQQVHNDFTMLSQPFVGHNTDLTKVMAMA